MISRIQWVWSVLTLFSDQNTITSTTPLHGRSIGHTKIPQRCARGIYRCTRRRVQNAIPRGDINSSTAIDKSGCELYCIYLYEAICPQPSTKYF